MGYIHEGMNGEIGKVKRRDGTIHELHIYPDSKDFPDFNMILLVGNNEHIQAERVPINEELWQKIGVCLGYKFKRWKD
jgi:hypothetical protein